MHTVRWYRMSTSVRIGKTANEQLDALHDHLNEQTRHELSKREALDVIVEDRYNNEFEDGD